MRSKSILVMSFVFLVCGAGSITKAAQLIATFDSFSEGDGGASLTDGGITFSNCEYFPGIKGGFYIDRYGYNSGFEPFFSPPNYLNAGAGYFPGPGWGFDAFSSAEITCGSDAIAGSLEIFHLDEQNSNILTMEALLDGSIVATNIITFNVGGSTYRPGTFHQTMAISGVTFDTLKLIASGPGHNGVVAICFDNVRIDTVPEPATLFLLGLGGLALLRKRRA